MTIFINEAMQHAARVDQVLRDHLDYARQIGCIVVQDMIECPTIDHVRLLDLDWKARFLKINK